MFSLDAANIKERLQFIKRRSHGDLSAEILEEEIDQKERALKEKIRELSGVLVGRQKECENIIGALSTEIESMDFTSAGALHTQSLIQTIQKLKSVHAGLKETLLREEISFQEEKIRKRELQQSFATLRLTLGTKPKKNPMQQALLAAGEKTILKMSETIT